MIRNYLIIAFRYLIRNRVFTFIEVFGLTIGLTSTILLLIFIRHEVSYDCFFPGYERIFRIESKVETTDGQVLELPNTLSEIRDLLINNHNEVNSVCRLFLESQYYYENKNREFEHIRFYYVDSSFFKVFRIQQISGNLDHALRKPFTTVLTRSLADELFGTEDPLGKMLEIHNEDYRVTALIEDLPSNSHLKFDLLLSMNTLDEKDILKKRKSLDFTTYLHLAEDVDIETAKSTLLKTIDDAVNTHYKGSGIKVKTTLKPVSDIHLHSAGIDFHLSVPGNMKNIYLFSFLAFFILVIAITNVINLIVANSVNRLRDVGIRKIHGADRKCLIFQFMSESFLLTFFSLLLSLIFAAVFLPDYSRLLDRELAMSFRENLLLFSGLAIIALVIGIMSGYFPALYLSRFNQLDILNLKGSQYRSQRLKIISVIVQFSITMFLISSFILLNRQLKYLKTADLGFNENNLLVFYKVNQRFRKDFRRIKEDILSLSDVLNAAASDGIPGNVSSVQNIWLDDDIQDNAVMIKENRIRNDYLSTYQMELIDGRNFSPVLDTDTGKFILNETAVQTLGLESPVGKVINVWNHLDTVIGVVKDFHYESFYQTIRPLVISRYFKPYQYITIRLRQGYDEEVIEKINQVLTKHFPNEAYTHYFLSEHLDSLYATDEQNTKLVFFGTLLAILIAGLGLYGLTSLTISQKVKEIGVRKAMGADTGDIVFNVTGDIIKYVLLAILISLLPTWWFLSKWLDHFAFNTNIPWWLFPVSGGISIIIAITSVLYWIIKTVRSNPAQSLKYE
ncbi:MAG: ABC transporter permease [Bacteroidales bacterium]|nr:ABC transporter permease [Bacteroidales bacterium]